jgi:hypothetical protein
MLEKIQVVPAAAIDDPDEVSPELAMHVSAMGCDRLCARSTFAVVRPAEEREH